MSKSIMAYLALVSLVLAGLAFGFTFPRQALAPASEPRLALVIGNADYAGDPLATAVNDAGLVAEALRAAGLEVSGAANLDQDSMRRAFWDFLSRAAQAGPRAIIFVYLSGRGLQYQGENYFAPIGAAINRVGDAPSDALRVSDFTQALASMPLRARIFVLDAARENRFAPDEQPRGNRFAEDGQPFAGGLALVETAPGALYAFNAAPGTIAPNEPPPYGAYAKALAEMLRVRGIAIDEAFSRARLRVNELTRGAFVPWDTAKLVEPVVLRDAGCGALRGAVPCRAPRASDPRVSRHGSLLCGDRARHAGGIRGLSRRLPGRQARGPHSSFACGAARGFDLASGDRGEHAKRLSEL